MKVKQKEDYSKTRLEVELEKLNFQLTHYIHNIDCLRPIVYCYVNKRTGLVDYVGSTGQNEKRIYRRLTRSNINFDKYYRTHRNEFDFYVIRRCTSRDEAYEYERKFIYWLRPKFNISFNTRDIVETYRIS